jgi:HTH-type transcriptional regulator/antitoxin HigA
MSTAKKLIDTLKEDAYLMELQGLNQTDLSKELGGQPVVSKILKGERELNLRQVKALAKRFKVSPEVFI